MNVFRLLRYTRLIYKAVSEKRWSDVREYALVIAEVVGFGAVADSLDQLIKAITDSNYDKIAGIVAGLIDNVLNALKGMPVGASTASSDVALDEVCVSELNGLEFDVSAAKANTEGIGEVVLIVEAILKLVHWFRNR